MDQCPDAFSLSGQLVDNGAAGFTRSTSDENHKQNLLQKAVMILQR
jgi:hypothetical protein